MNIPRAITVCAVLVSLGQVAPGAMVDFVQTSDPAGVFPEQQGETELGQQAVTVQAPGVSGTLRFYGWYDQLGNRVADGNGTALNPASLVVYEPTTLTARYIDSALDDDQDGVPDWFELLHFGDTSPPATHDGDDDRYDLREEFARRTSPHVADPFRYRVVTRSDPPFLFPVTETFLPADAGSAQTPSRYQRRDGLLFAYWSVDGDRQVDSLGRASDPAMIVLGEAPAYEAVSHFVPPEQDSDQDGVRDWFEEQFGGGVGALPGSNADGDSLTFAEEAVAAGHPGLPDARVLGGVESARSARINFSDAGDACLTTNSRPAGIIDESRCVVPGSQVQIAAEDRAGTKRFTYWAVDGVVQRGADGTALRELLLTVDVDTMATAFYVEESADVDTDSVPDWFEQRHYGDLAQPAGADTDGDQLSLIEESIRGTNPNVADELLVRYRESSSPEGLFETVEEYLAPEDGSRASSSRFGEIPGFRFTHWEVNGDDVEDGLGRPLDPVTVEFGPPWGFDVVAHFIPVGDDADADGVPDWYETHFYGSLSKKATYNKDGDQFLLLDEFHHDTHPRIPDALSPGGVAAARSGGFTFMDKDDAHYVEASDPAGRIERDIYIVRGTKTVAHAESQYGEYRFTGWTRNGAEQRNPDGAAVNPITVRVMGDTTMLATLVPESADTDADGLRDWFELLHYGTLDQDSTSDTDGDGLRLGEELVRQTDPHTADPRVYRYVEWSDPVGLFPAVQAFYPGDELGTVSSSRFGAIGDWRFAYWSLNGVRFADHTGRGLDPLLVEFGDLLVYEGVALYLHELADEDVDGVPDWFEQHFTGTTDVTAGSDTDLDGLTFRQEFDRDTHPALRDRVRGGGLMPARSAPLSFSFRDHFQPVLKALVNGRLVDFFSRPCEIGPGFSVSGSCSPAAGDWDGDGDLDLFVGSASRTLSVFRNEGSPVTPNFRDGTLTFGPLQEIAAGPLRPALGDWDRDGMSDMAVLTQDGATFLFASDGLWSSSGRAPVQQLALPADALSTGFFDADGDGWLDLVALLGTGELRAFRNTRSAVPFEDTAMGGVLTSVHVPGATGLDFGDTDGDGLIDILVADEHGRIWEFGQNADGSFTLRSRVWGSHHGRLGPGLSISTGDWDGDGDLDLVSGCSRGKLSLLRNPQEHLPVTPPVQTVTSGQTIQLRCPDAVLPATWALGRDASGASIDPLTGIYTAGETAGVDSVEVTDAWGMSGRAWINVIARQDATTAAKAIIVAGRRSPADAIWPAVDSLSRQAYSTLRLRGFAPEHILFLSHSATAAGVDARPSLERLQAALTDATFLGADAPSLVIYLVDHGRRAGAGVEFVLSEDETLPVESLDAWITQLHNTYSECRVVVAADCCYAGRFVDALQDSAGRSRTVLAACGTDELTHFVSQGLVSFSHTFWSTAGTGTTLQESFNAAQSSVSRLQTAVIAKSDDTAQFPLGPDFVAGSDRPVIGTVCPAQVLDGSDSADIWVSDIAGGSATKRVWAIVVPPDYHPVGQSPVTNLPEAELVWNPRRDRWEGVVGGFATATAGVPYTVMVFAQDIWDAVSLPAETTIEQSGYRKKAIFFAAGNAASPDWEAVARLVLKARSACLARGLPTRDVALLADTMTVPATPEALRQQLLTWAPGGGVGALTLYLAGAGSPDGLVCADGSILRPADLAEWLDALQDATGCTINLIVEADHAGIFLGCASPGRERVIATSTEASTGASLGAKGWLSFSNWLWDSIAGGRDLQQAFSDALAVGRSLGLGLRAQLDDTGDGQWSKLDGELAATRFVGAAFVTGHEAPSIGLACPATFIAEGGSALLWVARIDTADDLPPEEVWVEIAPVGAGPDDEIELYELQWDADRGIYWVSIGPFGHVGEYSALIYAGSPGSVTGISRPAHVSVFYGDPGLDPTQTPPATLPVLPLDGSEVTGHASPVSPARYRFHAHAGSRVTLDLSTSDPDADFELALVGAYDQTSPGADDWGDGFPERIWAWQPVVTGWYSIEIRPVRGVLSPPFCVMAYLEQASGADQYEPDNTAGTAVYARMGDGVVNRHSFHEPDDEDWVAFSARKAVSYRFAITDEDFAADAQLALFTGVGQTVLQEFAPEPGEDKTFDWLCEQSGTYLLRVQNGSPALASFGTGYGLSISATTGAALFGFAYGTLLGPDGAPVSGEVVCSTGQPAQVNANGTYWMALRAGAYKLTATSPSYRPLQIGIVVGANQGVEHDFVFASATRHNDRLRLHDGWNLVALPLRPDSGAVDDLFTGLDVDTPHGWNPGSQDFSHATDMETRRGYWVRGPVGGAEIDITGMPEPVYDLEVTQGWNLLGAAGDVPLPESDLQVGPIWVWDGAEQKYVQPESLTRGQAFWFFASVDGVLSLLR